MTHTATDLLIIMCPVCGSDGAVLRHDIRCSLLYSCQQCEHEWQIDPTEEPVMSQNTADESGRAAATEGRVFAWSERRTTGERRKVVVELWKATERRVGDRRTAA